MTKNHLPPYLSVKDPHGRSSHQGDPAIHRKTSKIYPLKLVIVHSYLSLPKDIDIDIDIYIYIYNVNPGLINHGLLIRGVLLQ